MLIANARRISLITVAGLLLFSLRLAAQSGKIKDELIERSIVLRSCEPELDSSIGSFKFVFAFSDTEDNRSLFPDVSPVALQRYTYEGMISVSDSIRFELLPLEYKLQIQLSENYYYALDLPKDGAFEVSICIEKLAFEGLKDDLFFDRFRMEGDTLWLEVYERYNDTAYGQVFYKYWKEEDVVHCYYNYMYSCAGPIGEGHRIIGSKELESLSFLELELNRANDNVEDALKNEQVSSTRIYYKIEYKDYIKRGMLKLKGDQQLLRDTGLFRTK